LLAPLPQAQHIAHRCLSAHELEERLRKHGRVLDRSLI
jgi:hypothetical protein